MNMRELLEHAGFRIRSAKRADCVHCTGRSRATVSYTDEVAYCHRCHWTANEVTLARQLGVAGALRPRPASDLARQLGVATALRRHSSSGAWRGKPAATPQPMPSSTDLARQRRDALLREFEAWRQGRIQRLYDEDRARTRAIMRCADWMQRIPECEEQAWEALKRFYDQTAKLNAAIDFLTCAVGSRWLERDSTIADVFRAWRRWLRSQR